MSQKTHFLDRATKDSVSERGLNQPFRYCRSKQHKERVKIVEENLISSFGTNLDGSS